MQEGAYPKKKQKRVAGQFAVIFSRLRFAYVKHPGSGYDEGLPCDSRIRRHEGWCCRCEGPVTISVRWIIGSQRKEGRTPEEVDKPSFSDILPCHEPKGRSPTRHSPEDKRSVHVSKKARSHNTCVCM